MAPRPLRPRDTADRMKNLPVVCRSGRAWLWLQDFRYLSGEEAYRCPAGQRPAYRMTTQEDGKTLRRYWKTACGACALTGC
jgi:hypothetical protein